MFDVEPRFDEKIYGEDQSLSLLRIDSLLTGARLTVVHPRRNHYFSRYNQSIERLIHSRNRDRDIFKVEMAELQDFCDGYDTSVDQVHERDGEVFLDYRFMNSCEEDISNFV